MVELQPAQPSYPPEGPGNTEFGEDFVVKRRGKGSHSVSCTWNIADFGGNNKQKVLYSKYFEVGGYDCRLLVYPSGMFSHETMQYRNNACRLVLVLELH